MKTARMVCCLALSVIPLTHATELLQVSESGVGAFEVDLARSSDRIAVAWYDTRHGNGEIYLRLVHVDGRPASPEYRVTNTPDQSYEVSAGFLADGVALAWYEKTQSGAHFGQIGLWRDGNGLAWTRAISPANVETRNPVVRTHENQIFAAWIEQDATGDEVVMCNWWDAGGKPLHAPLVIGRASPTTWNLNAAVDKNHVAHVVFDDESRSKASEIYYARIDGMTVSNERLTSDDGFPSKYPDIVYSPAGVAVTWFDEKDGNREVYIHASPKHALRGTIDDQSFRVTTTDGASIGAYLAANDNRIGLAWSDDTDGQYEIFFQEFSFDAKARSEPRRLSNTAPQSLIPSIEAYGTDFIVAWNEVIRPAAGYHSEETRSEVVFRRVVP